MNYALFVIICLAIFAYIIISKKRAESQQNKIEQKETEALPDFERAFFERTQAGEKAQILMSLASQQDTAIIRSLLQAENIPSYTEGEHMNNVYGGISGSMTAVVAIKLYILCADYEKACEIVKNYKMDSTGYTIFPKAEEN